MNIRGAVPADQPTLLRHCLGLASESEGIQLDNAVASTGVASAIVDPEKARYFIAERDGQIVGSLFTSKEWSDWRNGWYWWIQGVYVEPQARRTGVYSALYQAVKDAAISAGDVHSIRLYVHKDNPARKAYENDGMMLEQYVVYDGPLA